VIDFHNMQQQVHQTAVDHGWWEPGEINPRIRKLIALLNSGPPEEVRWDLVRELMSRISEPRTVGDQIALMHSELSEALEEFRVNPDPRHIYYREDGKPEGFGFELADVVIRIMDTCEMYDIPLERFIVEKNEFNKTRSYKHGGKAI